MSRINIHPLLQAAAGVLLCALTACSDGPGPGQEQTRHFQLALNASTEESTLEGVRLHECFLFGFFELQEPLEREGTVRFPISIARRMYQQRGHHAETTTADSTVDEGVLEYSGLETERLTIAVGAGPYTVTLGPGDKLATEPNEYTGEWTCGPAVPLANDSTLVAYGFDPALELVGTWRVSEVPGLIE